MAEMNVAHFVFIKTKIEEQIITFLPNSIIVFLLRTVQGHNVLCCHTNNLIPHWVQKPFTICVIIDLSPQHLFLDINLVHYTVRTKPLRQNLHKPKSLLG